MDTIQEVVLQIYYGNFLLSNFFPLYFACCLCQKFIIIYWILLDDHI